MAGFRYTIEEKRFLTDLVRDKRMVFEAMIREAQEKGDSVLQNIITSQMAIADSAMEKLTGTFGE